MSMALSSPKTAVGVNPKSSISFASGTYWFRMKLNEGTGTSVAYTGNLSSGAISGNITIPGTTANLWTQMPNLEAQGDNGVNASLDLSDILDCSTLEGTILIFVRIGSPAVPSAVSHPLSFGAVNGAAGADGIQLRMFTTQLVQVTFSDESATTGYTLSAGSEVETATGLTSGFMVGLYRDSSVKDAVEMSIYNKGILAKTNDLSEKPNPLTTTLLAKGNNTGGVVAGTHWEVDQLMSDILLVRTSVDLRSSFGTISMEHHTQQFEMLRTLESLGV